MGMSGNRARVWLIALVVTVDAASRAVLATTAVLLAVTEAAASLLAFRVARERTV